MDMGREENRVRCMERVTWKLTLAIRKIDSQWEFAVWLKRGLCVNLEGWDWEEYMRGFRRERIYVYLWLIYDEV